MWVSVLSDPELENLELHQWARWARLIVFMKAHGTNGKLVFHAPFRALQNILRVQSFEELKVIVTSLPNFIIIPALHETEETTFQEPNSKAEKFMLVCRNWTKYQGDLSTKRVKKHRDKSSVSNSVTSNGECNGPRREEKRGEVTPTSPSPSPPRASRLAPLTGAVATREQKQREDQMTTEEMEKAEYRERNRAWQKETTEIPEAEKMTPEEMRAIRIKNFGPLKGERITPDGGKS